MANACKKPAKAQCLFYTRGLSKTARGYAKKQSPPMTTIWEMWPDMYYSKKPDTSNPLRCIMQKKTTQGKYFQHMSTAMASMCDVFATVMDKGVSPKTANFDAVRQDGIWYLQEYVQLQQGSLGKKVNQIDAISPDGKTSFTYYSRSAAKRGEFEPEFNVTANATDDDAPLSWEQWWEDDESFNDFDEDHIEARKAAPKQKNCKAPTDAEIAALGIDNLW